MKRLLFFFLAMSIFSFSGAHIPKPDFSFPKDVEKVAQADLAQAVAAHDAVKAINALMRIYVAATDIDPDRQQECIRLVESTADTFRGSDLDGVFCCLEAKLYLNFRESNYKSYGRDLPLYPLPEDLAEWSATQLTHRIDSLTTESFSKVNADKLALLPLKDCEWIVDYGKDAPAYYPTMLDFVLLKALDHTSNAGIVADVYRTAFGTTIPGTPPHIVWNVSYIEKNTSDFQKIDALKSLYEKNRESDYCGYILNVLGNIVSSLYYSDSNESRTEKTLNEQRSYLELAESFKKVYPRSPFVPNITHYCDIITRKSISVNYKGYIYPGESLHVNIRNSNVNDFAVELYKIRNVKDESYYYINNLQIFLASNKPVARVELSAAGTTPFRDITSVDIKVPGEGYYVVIPRFKGEGMNEYRGVPVRCCPVMPLAFSRCANPRMAIVNSLTGAPVAGASVQLVCKDQNYTSVTDNDGVADFSGIPGNLNFKHLTVTCQDGTFTFRDPYPGKYGLERSARSEYVANVLTDRSLYHRGEKMHFLAVVYKSDTDEHGAVTNTSAAGKKVTLAVINPNYEEIDTIEGVTDDFGRFYGETTLPDKGLSGTFTLSVKSDNKRIGYTNVTVSDYKLPDSEIVDAVAERNVPSEGDVTVSGCLKTFSGMPLSGAEITLDLNGLNYFRSFFGGPGEKIQSQQVKTDADGRFTYVFPASTFAKTESEGDNKPAPLDYDNLEFDEEEFETYPLYMVDINAVTPSGTTASDRVFFSLGKQYIVSLNLSNSNIDGTKPLSPDVTVYNALGDKVDLPLKWTLKDKEGNVVASGDYKGKIDLSKVTPGSYSLSFVTVDESLADAESENVTIYNENTDIVPGTSAIWLPDSNAAADADGRINVLYGTTKDVHLYVFAVSGNDARLINLLDLKKGYHHLDLTLPAHRPDVEVMIACVRDYELYTKTINILPAPARKLKIESESFRDRLVPTAQETWRIKVLDDEGSGVNAALALDMYNKALDALAPHSFDISPMRWMHSYIPFDISTVYIRSGSIEVMSKLNKLRVFNPDLNMYFRYIGGYYRMYSRAYSTDLGRPMRMKKSVNAMCVEEAEDEVMYDAAPMPMMSASMAESADTGGFDFDAAAEAVVTGSGGTIDRKAPEETEKDIYRDSEVALGIWAPSLTTDAQGNVVYTFTVPNANTTWRLMATAWTRDLVHGDIVREFVASKPVMVQPNSPRFMRCGDTSVMRATVMNASDENVTIKTLMEVFNPLTGEVLVSSAFADIIDANGSMTYDISYTAPSDLAAVGYRVKATAETSDVVFTDGEQTLIPVLSNRAQLIETSPFYLNPGDTEYRQRLPKQKDARLTLTFCENPAWTIVTALPGMRQKVQKYANSAAAAIFSAAVSKGITDANPEIGKAIKLWQENPTDSALVSMLEKNEDLKLAALNCSPWVQASKSDTERMANLALVFDNDEIDRAIAEGVEILADLQREDGGWSWADWCDESSLWVTSNVLSMFAELKSYGWMPVNTKLDEMIVRAVKWYDKTTEKDARKDSERFDLIYCLFRPYFTDIKNVSNGEKVINATLKKLSDNWKSYSDPAYKSMAAEALWLNGRKSEGLKIMESVSQFGVYTKNQGLRFPSVNALYDYAIILEAFARILPDSKEVDGLRQQLIVRKQATDWGDAVVTTEVVSSILASGSKWTVEAKGAEVTAGGKLISPVNPVESSTGSLRADISPYHGKELVVKTTGAGPAYGAVYAQFSETISDVQAVGIDDLDIRKELYVRRGTDWEYVTDGTPLAVGDRVKVQLTIHNKRNMQYVTIRDERPAAFEPVDQLPGWEWSEGVGFYRESNDDNTSLNVVYMRPGTYLLTYEVNVNTAGTYSSGVASIQSQYEPSLSAHSAGNILKINLK